MAQPIAASRRGKQWAHPSRPEAGEAPLQFIGSLDGEYPTYLSGDDRPEGNYMTTTMSALQLALIKGRQQQTWAAGDYGMIGTTLVLVSEQLCEAVDLRAGQKVLTWPVATATPRWPPPAASAS